VNAELKLAYTFPSARVTSVSVFSLKVKGQLELGLCRALYEGHPKVSGLNVLDNNIFYNLYVSETYILYKL